MAGIAIWQALQVILVLGLCLPEWAGRFHLRDNLGWPQAGSIDILDGVLRYLLLRFAGVENGRAVAGAQVVALAIFRAGVVDLEKEFEDLAIADDGWIEDDFDRFGVRAMIAVSGVGHVAAAVAYARSEHARITAQQILHAPEAAACQDGGFSVVVMCHGDWFLVQHYVKQPSYRVVDFSAGRASKRWSCAA